MVVCFLFFHFGSQCNFLTLKDRALKNAEEIQSLNVKHIRCDTKDLEEMVCQNA